MYSKIFPNHEPPAENPQRWSIHFMLEVVTVLTTFKDCCDVRYATLINLLENYIPLVLSTYGVIFRTNSSKQYFHAMFHVWILFTAFIIAIMTKHH